MAPTVAEQPATVPAKKAELKVRVMSGAVYGAVFIGALWAGGWVLGGFLAVLWLLAVWEWARLTGGARPVGSAALILLMPIGYAASIATGAQLFVVAIPLVMLVAGILWPWMRWPALGMAYLGWPAIAGIIFFNLNQFSGASPAIWLVGVVWATDVSAYFVGRAIRGPKLAPRVSPGKTWSGAAGGLTGAAAAGAIAGIFLGGAQWAGPAAVVALWVSAWAQVGDLFESWVKRRFEVKDSGTLIPGHGGVLDRIDGLLFGILATVPVMAGTAILAFGS